MNRRSDKEGRSQRAPDGPGGFSHGQVRSSTWLLASLPVIMCALLLQQPVTTFSTVMSLLYIVGALYLIYRGLTCGLRGTSPLVSTFVGMVLLGIVSVAGLSAMVTLIAPEPVRSYQECVTDTAGSQAAASCQETFIKDMESLLGGSEG